MSTGLCVAASRSTVVRWRFRRHLQRACICRRIVLTPDGSGTGDGIFAVALRLSDGAVARRGTAKICKTWHFDAIQLFSGRDALLTVQIDTVVE